MKYEIITDRFEIEKMAEDMFLSDDEILVHIDYADLRTLKRHGTFKHAIICDIELGNKAWANELINVIQSQQQPIDTLQAFLMNINHIHCVSQNKTCLVPHRSSIMY